VTAPSHRDNAQITIEETRVYSERAALRANGTFSVDFLTKEVVRREDKSDDKPSK